MDNISTQDNNNSGQTYNQQEILTLINQYNTKDPNTRKAIKHNYIRILKEFNIRPKQVIELGYNPTNVRVWSTKSSPNIPMLDQSLAIACAFNFDVMEFLKEVV